MDKDIDIQVGDKITYRIILSGEIIEMLVDDNGVVDNIQEDIQENRLEIIKIERTKYEVIEEKKELLTEEERDFLKQVLEFGNYKEETTNGIIKFLIKEGYYIKLYYSDWACNSIYIDKKLYFKNLEEDEKYTLKELGLEDN